MRLPSLWRDSGLQRAFGDDLEKFFDDFFTRRGMLPKATEIAPFTPDVDVVERDGDFLVKAELPGMSISDIEVTMAGENLQIKGEKKEEKEEKEEGYTSYECRYGSFFRSIPLPTAVQADRIEAKLEKGVLSVVCPKSEIVKPTKIEVKGETKEVAPVAPDSAEAPRPREEKLAAVG